MKRYTVDEVFAHLQEETRRTTAQYVATQYGFSPQYINDVLHGRRKLAEKLANALGFYLVREVYEKIPNKEKYHGN
jgi:hypothetical protein